MKLGLRGPTTIENFNNETSANLNSNKELFIAISNTLRTFSNISVNHSTTPGSKLGNFMSKGVFWTFWGYTY